MKTKNKGGRPKVDKKRIKDNFSIPDTLIVKFNDFINSKSLNGSKLLEKLILEHLKNNFKNPI